MMLSTTCQQQLGVLLYLINMQK